MKLLTWNLFLLNQIDFSEKSEFFSELKLSAVDDEKYENSKCLYQTLEMRCNITN